METRPIRGRAATIDLFTRKSADWKYEEEVRIVLIGKKDIIKFNKSFLKGIIFGCNTGKKEKKAIYSIVKKINYQITFKEAIKGDFKLEFRVLE